MDSDGNIIDTQSAGESFDGTAIAYDNSDDALEIIRHSTAHLDGAGDHGALSQLTVLCRDLWWMRGFYYDFRVDEQIGENDLKKHREKDERAYQEKV